MSKSLGSNFGIFLEENEIPDNFQLFGPRGIRFVKDIRSVWEGIFFLSLVS